MLIRLMPRVQAKSAPALPFHARHPAAIEALMAEADRIRADAVVMPGPPPKIMICAHVWHPSHLASKAVNSR